MSSSTTSHRQSGRAAIVAVSVLVHALVLMVLGLSAPALREVRRTDPRAVDAELWRPPRDALTARSALASAARPSPAAPRRPALLRPPTTVAPFPAAPASPMPSVATGVGVPASPQPGPGAESLRQALRGSTVGCANRDAVGLTRRERDACDEVFGRARDQATIADPPMDPAKRAAWDAVAARKALSRKRKEGPVPPGLPTNDNAGGTRTNGIGILGY